MTATLADQPALALVDRYLREVVTGAGPAVADDLIGNEVLRQRTAALRTAFPDLTLSILKLIGDEDLVAVHATATGTHHGTFHGVPATGRRWHASYTAILRIAEGRIADFWENWDQLAILEQLGAVRRVDGVSA